MKLWEKNYTLNKKIEQFTVGNDPLLDTYLIPYDCQASQAHAALLKKMKILSTQEYNDIHQTLQEIQTLHKNNQFIIRQEDEDCHTAIENYLIKKLGDTGKKIHTYRSRNDQIQTALRLYYKAELTTIQNLVEELIKTMQLFSKKNGSIQWPGYTHMRKAMPSSIQLWATAYVDSFKDTQKLLKTIYHIIDQSPLGTGAGYGFTQPINRKITQEKLMFSKIQNNPIYVQNSRGKFEALLLHGLCQIFYDLNKIASDLILFSMPEFGYIILPSELCTGSSIMPHKKNPDALELLRAYYHEVLAYQFQTQTITANLISGYNRDIQLTKKPMIHGFLITKQSIDIMNLIFTKIKIDKQKCTQAMTPELFSTEKIYQQVHQGTPFREAYKKTAQDYEQN